MATRVMFPFTQNQAFSAVINLIQNGKAVYATKDGEVEADPAKLVEFFEHRIEQNEKKASAPKQLTERQKQNEELKSAMIANMEIGERYTIGDMLMKFDCFEAGTSPQRVSALLSQMGAKGTGEIVRTEEKGKAYFSLA